MSETVRLDRGNPVLLRMICIDFDRTIHRYSEGWMDGRIYDPVVPGFFEWAADMTRSGGFELIVYSSRSKTEAGIKAMQHWLTHQYRLWAQDHPEHPPLTFSFAHEKPAAWVTIDDRAIQFRGNWQAPELAPEAVRDYKPW